MIGVGMSQLAKAMWRQALHDLDYAAKSVAGEDYDWACLAAQQAAEKAIKAVLLLSGLRADPPHNLPGLFDALVGAGVTDRATRARLHPALVSLTLAFAVLRYPNMDMAIAAVDLILASQATQAIEAAKEILAEARLLARELDT